MTGYIGQLLMPDMYDAAQQGIKDGQNQLRQRTLAQYVQPALGGDQGALSKIYGVDPDAGVKVQQNASTMQQQAATDKNAGMANLGKAAHMVAAAASSGDMGMATQIYNAQMVPLSRSVLGKDAPPLTPDMIQHIKTIGDTLDPATKQDLIKGSPGDVFMDPSTGKPAFTVPGDKAEKGQLIQTTQGYGWAMPDGSVKYLNDGSQPAQQGATQAAGSPAPGGGILSAIATQESGNNASAVSPKGAVGTMQTMPSTLTNPGFGVTPAQNNSPGEQTRVGNDYFNALLTRYGGNTAQALAAYNAGPGRVDSAMSANGGDFNAALGTLPKETQNYVPQVLARAGQSGADPAGRVMPAAKGQGQNIPSGYQWNADKTALAPIPGGPADHSAGVDQGLSPDAITDAAWDKILNGKDIPGYGKQGVAQRAQVRNAVAQIAKDAGVSAQDLVTTQGRNKALQASLTNLQKKSDAMQGQEVAFNRNLDYAQQISDQVARSGSPALNKWIMGAKEQMGDPDVVKLDAALTPVAADYARIMQGSTGSGGTPITTMQEAKTMLRKQLSKQQFGAVADVLRNDIKNQQSATADQLDIVRSHMSEFGSTGGQSSSASPNPADKDPLGLLK